MSVVIKVSRKEMYRALKTGKRITHLNWYDLEYVYLKDGVYLDEHHKHIDNFENLELYKEKRYDTGWIILR